MFHEFHSCIVVSNIYISFLNLTSGETEPGELMSQADGFSSTFQPAAKTGGFDWKILGAENPKKNLGTDSNGIFF